MTYKVLTYPLLANTKIHSGPRCENGAMDFETSLSTNDFSVGESVVGSKPVHVVQEVRIVARQKI